MKYAVGDFVESLPATREVILRRFATINSITLSAGDWYVYGQVTYTCEPYNLVPFSEALVGFSESESSFSYPKFKSYIPITPYAPSQDSKNTLQKLTVNVGTVLTIGSEDTPVYLISQVTLLSEMYINYLGYIFARRIA